jgi:hypothetical protein
MSFSPSFLSLLNVTPTPLVDRTANMYSLGRPRLRVSSFSSSFSE